MIIILNLVGTGNAGEVMVHEMVVAFDANGQFSVRSGNGTGGFFSNMAPTFNHKLITRLTTTPIPAP